MRRVEGDDGENTTRGDWGPGKKLDNLGFATQPLSTSLESRNDISLLRLLRSPLSPKKLLSICSGPTACASQTRLNTSLSPVIHLSILPSLESLSSESPGIGPICVTCSRLLWSNLVGPHYSSTLALWAYSLGCIHVSLSYPRSPTSHLRSSNPFDTSDCA